MRGAELSTVALNDALASENVASQETIEISSTREIPAGEDRTRSTSYDEPAIEVEVPDPGEQWGQFILYTDESGVTTWNFARDQVGGIDTMRGQERRAYVIRRHVAPPAETGTRGLIGAVGKKILKVLVFPILDPLIGKVGDYFAGEWEKKKRPYQIRTFTPGNYREPDAAAIEGDRWRRLSEGRALLVVHGTFARTHTAFGGLPPDYVELLHKEYAGRVFAFDHFTMSEDPKQNAAWFLHQVPNTVRLDLDIICHSRGGLVSRALAERQAELTAYGTKVQVRKIVFVAAPNSGTILTDTKHLGDFIDSYTNLLNFFPDNGVTTVLEAVITVAKQLSLATVKGLYGLQSMLPGGSFLSGWLNRGGRDETKYYALGADFEPVDAGLRAYARDRLMDKIFKVQNDLVVPTASVYESNGSGFFPITEKTVFPSPGLHHSGFFADVTSRRAILAWLTS